MLSILLRILNVKFASADSILAVCQIERLVRRIWSVAHAERRQQ
jgi:hypothetical protein